MLRALNINLPRVQREYITFEVTMESPETTMRFKSELPKAWSSKNVYDGLVAPALSQYYSLQPPGAKSKFRARDINISINGEPIDGTKPLSLYAAPSGASAPELRLAFPGVAAFSPKGTYAPPSVSLE